MARIPGDQRGIYDNDHFSGAQVALYIGDVWVDEVTSLQFEVSQQRAPIYGYASQLFDAVAQGNVLVQGQFSINFKEAGYLWLILNRYKQMMGVRGSHRTPIKPGWEREDGSKVSEWASKANIERIVSDEPAYDRMGKMKDFAAMQEEFVKAGRAQEAMHISGFASTERAVGHMGAAENTFEAFEDLLWKTNGNPEGAIEGYDAGKDGRRADVTSLNPFDIYIQYGDYVGDDRIHHTIQKLESVYIIGTSKQIVISGEPIQETYSFIARNLL